MSSYILVSCILSLAFFQKQSCWQPRNCIQQSGRQKLDALSSVYCSAASFLSPPLDMARTPPPLDQGSFTTGSQVPRMRRMPGFRTQWSWNSWCLITERPTERQSDRKDGDLFREKHTPQRERGPSQRARVALIILFLLYFPLFLPF